MVYAFRQMPSGNYMEGLSKVSGRSS